MHGNEVRVLEFAARLSSSLRPGKSAMASGRVCRIRSQPGKSPNLAKDTTMQDKA
jgi:hypothetical protein